MCGIIAYMVRKEDYRYTNLTIFISHFLISVFLALAFGTVHPFANMYVAGKPVPYILMACLVALPVYAIFGYFFILGKEYLGGMNKVLRVCCFLYLILLLLLYIACYMMIKYNVSRIAWRYYVILNYPTGVVFNNISLNTDALNLWFILTTIPGPLGFYIGSLMRFNYESISVNKGRK